MKSFTAGPNDVGARLSRFVLNVTQNLPSSVRYKGFRNKRIKVNGKTTLDQTRDKLMGVRRGQVNGLDLDF